jgi:hypothetical protein
MKEAKQKFDSLVERVQQGGKAHFGEVERVVAESLLQRHLATIFSDEETKRAQRFYRDHLVDGDEYEEDVSELGTSQLMRYRLEMTRSIIGTLGVRPTVEDMSPYLTRAIERHDWDLMDSVLSLTQEGKVQEGVIERVALDELLRGSSRSYEKLKEKFPSMKFTAELVEPVYEKTLDYHHLEALQKIREETGIEIPKNVIEADYLKQFARIERNPGSVNKLIDEMKKVADITKVKPKTTRHAVRMLRNLFSDENVAFDVRSSQFAQLERFFSIYANPRLSVLLQAAALQDPSNRERGSLFLDLYENSSAKVPDRVIQRAFTQLQEKGNSVAIESLCEATEVYPKGDVLQWMYDQFLTTNKYDSLIEYHQKTGIKPEFSDEVISTSIEQKTRSSSFKRMGKLIEIVKLAEKEIPTEALQKYATEYVSERTGRSGTSRFEDAEKFLKDNKIPVPEDLPSIGLTQLVDSIASVIFNSEGRNSVRKNEGYDWRSSSRKVSPFEISQHDQSRRYAHEDLKKGYQQFRDEVRKELANVARASQKIKKRHPSATARDNDSVQLSYKRSLEVVLLQSHRKERKLAPIGKVISAVGVAPSPQTIQKAVVGYLERNSQYADQETIERVGAAVAAEIGLDTLLTSEDTNEIALKLISKGELGSPVYAHRLQRLRILGNVERFSETVQGRFKEKALAALEQADTNAYGNWKSFIDSDIEIPEDNLQVIKGRAKHLLANNNTRSYQSLKEVVGQPLVTQDDLTDVATQFLAQSEIVRYDRLMAVEPFAPQFNDAQREKIRSVVMASLVEDHDKYKKVPEIVARTGFTITATPNELKKIVEKYFEKDNFYATHPEKIAAALGQQLDSRQIKRRIVTLVESYEPGGHNSKLEQAKELATNTGISLVAEEVESEIRWRRTDVTFDYMQRFNRAIGYSPSDAFVDRLYGQISRSEYRLGEKVDQIMKISGKAPPEALALDIIAQACSQIVSSRRDNKDWHIEGVARKLVEEHGYSVGETQAEQLKSRYIQAVSSGDGLWNAQSYLRDFKVEMTVDDQQKIFETIERNIGNVPAYSRVKRQGFSDLSLYVPQYVTDPSIREKASARAAELLASERIYQGCVYMESLGVQPSFTEEQFNAFQENLLSHENRFTRGQLGTLRSLRRAQ